VYNLPAKFEVSSFNRLRDMEGVPKLLVYGANAKSTAVRVLFLP